MRRSIVPFVVLVLGLVDLLREHLHDRTWEAVAAVTIDGRSTFEFERFGLPCRFDVRRSAL